MSALEDTVRNLRILADHIEKNVPEHLIDMEDFWKFRQTPLELVEKGWSEITEEYPIDCGTSACALGWASTCPSLYSEVLETSQYWMVWERYSEELFPFDAMIMYGGHWSSVFGTHLSSDKEEVVRRLRNKADGLENHYG